MKIITRQKAIGISVNDISERIKRLEPGDKKMIDDIKSDINYALEFSEVISTEEKQGLERLKLQLKSIQFSNQNGLQILDRNVIQRIKF